MCAFNHPSCGANYRRVLETLSASALAPRRAPGSLTDVLLLKLASREPAWQVRFWPKAALDGSISSAAQSLQLRIP